MLRRSGTGQREKNSVRVYVFRLPLNSDIARRSWRFAFAPEADPALLHLVKLAHTAKHCCAIVCETDLRQRLCALEDRRCRPAGRRALFHEPQLITPDNKRAPVVLAVPVWKCRAVDLKSHIGGGDVGLFARLSPGLEAPYYTCCTLCITARLAADVVGRNVTFNRRPRSFCAVGVALIGCCDLKSEGQKIVNFRFPRFLLCSILPRRVSR
jgi:hypothetical protein